MSFHFFSFLPVEKSFDRTSLSSCISDDGNIKTRELSVGISVFNATVFSIQIHISTQIETKVMTVSKKVLNSCSDNHVILNILSIGSYLG